MRNFFGCVILCLVGLSQTERWNYWKGGFMGETCFTAPANMDGWTLRITFTEDVDSLVEVWNGALKTQKSKRIFFLEDVYYNKNAPEGTRVCPGFKGLTNTNRPTAVIKFIPKFATSVNQTTQEVNIDNPTVFAAGDIVYDDVLGLSILFYEAQRSGHLPSNNRIPYRGDSALHDKGLNGEDLTGGWYDAGDFVKFNLPMASSTTILLWGLYRFKDAYEATNQLEHMYSSVKWPLDYFLKCWIPGRNEYYYQVGDPKIDHDYWGRPEEMTMNRPAFKLTTSVKGSDVAGETAAAMAAGSIVFKTKDSAYSNKLLTAAKTLYTFAKTYKGKYPLTDDYVSSGYDDELCIAALWLYKATNQQHYLNDGKFFAPTNIPWAYSWDDKAIACQLMLFEITKESVYKLYVENFFNQWRSGSNPPYTPGGLAYRAQWGSLAYSASVAFVSLVAAEDGIQTQTNRDWAIKQINYMLGDNKLKMSYVVGYSSKYPLRVHHASSSCPAKPKSCGWGEFDSKDPNPFVISGALVGGPDINDNYHDDRSKYEFTEVACDYNAGFQSAIAGLVKGWKD